MKTPTLEEVKEYFKNAKDIKSVWGIFESNININEIYLDKKDYSWNTSTGNIIFMGNKWAEIISYKEEIEKPKHYKTDSIDVIDFCKIYDLNFNIGNIIKYVCRAGKKGDRLEDLYKAKDYLEREIKHYEK